MNACKRWLKFNLVGAMGMAVQLATLALFSRWMRGHYLWASAAAIELTLLHNFVWHQRFTWRDRQDGAPWARQLWRFHLSNGLVSLVGNLVLMRLLVGGVHLPLLASNGLAILGCSMANFWLGNRWAFAADDAASAQPARRKPSAPACYNSQRRRGAETHCLCGVPASRRLQDAEVPEHVRPFKMGNNQA